ncbi:hypothetical protein ACWCQL_14055 [Streptomyces sp. NPDC002073]
MSHNQPGPYGQPQQPGPYGGQPQQPNPYGQQPQQPNPYGQPAPQPGYGYPQQAPQGVPQQGYGYPQQPGMPPQPNQYGQQPPTPPYGGPMQPMQPPAKKKTGLIVVAAIVGLAVVGGGAYALMGSKGGSADISADTKGYKLVAPASVAEFKKDGKSSAEEFSAKDKAELTAAGMKNPTQVAQDYKAGDGANPLTAKALSFKGYYGEVSDPEKLVDAYFALAEKSAAEEDEKVSADFVGSPQAMNPAGFKGAVMKCQEIKITPKESSQPGMPKDMTMPVCLWSDYSTLGFVSAADVAAVMGGTKGYTLEQTAEYTAKLYSTARVKK